MAHDLEAMARAIDADTRVVFIANPNNPTGTLLAPGEIEAFLRARAAAGARSCSTRPTTSTCRRRKRYDSVAWLARHPNLIVTRTFSKAYGLAGLRVGLRALRTRASPTS